MRSVAPATGPPGAAGSSSGRCVHAPRVLPFDRCATRSAIRAATVALVVDDPNAHLRKSRTVRAADYERLTQALAVRLAEFLGTATETCQHNVTLEGRGTSNQIDVMWLGTLDGVRRRIVIECKNYGRALDQGRIHAFTNVVRDISIDGIPTVGVVVTPIGYQRGARELAATYDIIILELRRPLDSDLANRIVRIDVGVEIEMIGFDAVEFNWISRNPDAYAPPTLLELAMLTPLSGGPPIAVQRLLALKLGATHSEQFEASHDNPRCSVQLSEPHIVDVYGEQLGQVIAVAGTARAMCQGESFSVGPGREGIAHVLIDALDGATAWFTVDGQTRVLSGRQGQEPRDTSASKSPDN